MRTTTAREYGKGTLVVDILDHKQRKLIWRSTDKDRIGSNNDPETVTQNINDAIRIIMKDFPAVMQ